MIDHGVVGSCVVCDLYRKRDENGSGSRMGSMAVLLASLGLVVRPAGHLRLFHDCHTATYPVP
jgi:hypothetical protein